MRAIITRPPTYSASVNCQPRSTQSTSPSSHTRLVDANWNASAVAAEAPFWNRLLAIAIAAYEHDEDAAPMPVARAMAAKSSPASADSIRSRGTHACTTAEMKKPSTSAHHTSHAMRKAFHSPSPTVERTWDMDGGYPGEVPSPLSHAVASNACPH